MSKKIEKTNFRVEVYPDENEFGVYPLETDSQYRNACEDILSEIKRHVDGFGSISVRFDTEEVCEHCGYIWGNNDTYNGGCCEEDQKNQVIK